MTTIAYSKGYMASDTQVSDGHDYVLNIRKIKKVQGHLIGGCGDMDLLYWFLNNFRPEIITEGHRITPPSAVTDKDSFEGLVITPKRKIFMFTDKLMAIPVKSFGYMAIGSGTPVAMGAMYAGADAKTAIKAAMRHDGHTGGRLQTIKL